MPNCLRNWTSRRWRPRDRSEWIVAAPSGCAGRMRAKLARKGATRQHGRGGFEYADLAPMEKAGLT